MLNTEGCGNRNHRLLWTLFALSLLFPAICVASAAAGYNLVVHSGVGFARATTAVYAAASIILFCRKDKEISRGMCVPTALLPILNYINIIFYCFKTAYTTGNYTAQLIVAAWLVFSVTLVVMYIDIVWLKVVVLVLTGLLVIPVGLLLMFGSIGLDTVTDKAISPEGTYCAEVIDSDQGALGGDTYVTVYMRKGSFSVGSFEFRREERTAYTGGWGEFRDMEITWADEDTLVIDGREYDVNEMQTV